MDKKLIHLAVKEAWKYQGLTYPNPAVGAVVSTQEGFVISVQAHKEAGSPHAEVEAVKDAYIKLTNDKKLLSITDSREIHNYLRVNHNGLFFDKSLHVSLEPCNHYGKTPPCSILIKELGFKRVVIGTRDKNKKASGGYEYLKDNKIDIMITEKCQECEDLLRPFEKWQEERFVFFKLAMSLNGIIDGGKITSDDSFKMVHKLRDKTDLLIIGGNTVRTDRPTLDARLVDGKAPDILIYSKNDNFDRDIPLFGIPGREVHISDRFEIIKNYRFVMIEGGEGMLKATKDMVDYYLLFHSSNFKEGQAPSFSLNLNELCSIGIGPDRLGWYKKVE